MHRFDFATYLTEEWGRMSTLFVTRKAASFLVCSAFVFCFVATTYDSALAQMGKKEGDGLIGGALIGGIVGSMVGGGSTARIVGSVAGAAIGGFIGSRIGASLDEQDRMALARATRAAFVSGKKQRFANRSTGVRGTIEVSSSNRNSDGKLCRTVVQEVDQRGNVIRESLSACRGPGGWE